MHHGWGPINQPPLCLELPPGRGQQQLPVLPAPNCYVHPRHSGTRTAPPTARRLRRPPPPLLETYARAKRIFPAMHCLAAPTRLQAGGEARHALWGGGTLPCCWRWCFTRSQRSSWPRAGPGPPRGCCSPTLQEGKKKVGWVKRWCARACMAAVGRQVCMRAAGQYEQSAGNACAAQQQHVVLHVVLVALCAVQAAHAFIPQAHHPEAHVPRGAARPPTACASSKSRSTRCSSSSRCTCCKEGWTRKGT